MIDINFLKNPSTSIAGFEYMDYQDETFFKELSEKIKEGLDEEYIVRSDKQFKDEIKDIVFKHTGISIELVKSETLLGIDTGFFYPGAILNDEKVAALIAPKYSKLSEAFRYIKTDILKGGVDTSTGKIFGDYSKIFFTIHFSFDLSGIAPVIKKKNETFDVSALIAAGIIHELGHVFSNFVFVTKMATDNYLINHAISLLDNEENYGIKKSNIVNDTLTLLECDTRITEKDIEGMDKNDFILLLSKATNTRDLRRTLSLGTSKRSSEVLADAYAVRFGAGLDLIKFLSLIYSSNITNKMGGFFFGIGILLWFPSFSVLGVILWYTNLMLTLSPNSVYDTPYRRLKGVLRDQLVQLKASKNIPIKEKVKIIEKAKEMEKIVLENKPFLEGTGVQRLIGYLLSGSDFKLQQFEHYTEELMSNTLSLYEDHFKD